MIKRSSNSWLSLIGLSLTLGLASCSPMMDMTNPNTINTQPPHSSTQPPEENPERNFVQCPTFNPAQTICTMQYDPVCVKTESAGIVSYRTAGNACSACNTPEAVGYVPGECIQPDAALE